jgi:hypothetical protein
MAEAKLCRLNNNWNGPRWGQIVGVLCVPWLELFTATTHSLPWEYTSAIVASVLAVAFNGILSQCTHSNTPPVNGVAEGFDARQRWRWRRGTHSRIVSIILVPRIGPPIQTCYRSRRYERRERAQCHGCHARVAPSTWRPPCRT